MVKKSEDRAKKLQDSREKFLPGSDDDTDVDYSEDSFEQQIICSICSECVRDSAFENHLIMCRANYQGKWKVCSINPRHGPLPHPEMVAHIERCPDRGLTNDGDGAFPSFIVTDTLPSTTDRNALEGFLMDASEPTAEDLSAIIEAQNELDDVFADAFRSLSPDMNNSLEPNEEVVAYHVRPPSVPDGVAYGILEDDEVEFHGIVSSNYVDLTIEDRSYGDGAFPSFIVTDTLPSTTDRNALEGFLMDASEPTAEDLSAIIEAQNELDDVFADAFRSLSPDMNNSLEPNEEVVAYHVRPPSVPDGVAYGILEDDEVEFYGIVSSDYVDFSIEDRPYSFCG